MANKPIAKDTIGALITFNLKEPLPTDATTKEIRYKKPSGVTGQWAATVIDSTMSYTTQAGDISEAGTWRIECHISGTSYSFYTKVEQFEVFEHL